MKRFFFFFLIFGLMASFAFGAANGTRKNAGGAKTHIKNNTPFVEYTYTSTTSDSDSVGIHYSKAYSIRYFNTSQNVVYYDMIMSNAASGTEDCNVTIQFSNDKTTWVAGSLNSGVIKDALGTTAVRDSLNWYGGAYDIYWSLFDYVRFKFDFQTGNPSGTAVSASFKIPKDPAIPESWAEVTNHLD